MNDPDSAPATPPIQLHGAMWMSVGEDSLGGRGRVNLLRHILECGSITQAARRMGMSYKAAWDAIDSMNNLAQTPLVERVSGGKGGGGTRLTARGVQLVNNFTRLEIAHQAFLRHLEAQARGLVDDFELIRKIGMKTSARNQFLGIVKKIIKGAVNDEVTLTIQGGASLVAIITHESLEHLDLSEGMEVFALVKSSSVMLARPIEGARYSARNCFVGQVERVTPGAVNCEVVLHTPEGATLAALITQESCDELGLCAGAPVVGLFKASSVLLGVAQAF